MKCFYFCSSEEKHLFISFHFLIQNKNKDNTLKLGSMCLSMPQLKVSPLTISRHFSSFHSSRVTSKPFTWRMLEIFSFLHFHQFSVPLFIPFTCNCENYVSTYHENFIECLVIQFGYFYVFTYVVFVFTFTLDGQS